MAQNLSHVSSSRKIYTLDNLQAEEWSQVYADSICNKISFNLESIAVDATAKFGL